MMLCEYRVYLSLPKQDRFKSKIAKTVGKKKKAPLTLAELDPAFLRLQQYLENTGEDRKNYKYSIN